MEKNEMNELYEDVFRKVGNLTAKSQVLQAVVNVAMDNMKIHEGMLPTMEDNGAAVLLLISAFFPEEFEFRKAQLEREADEKRERTAKFVADHIQRHIDFAVSTQEGE